LPSGGEVMYFDYPTFVAFDVFILKRPGAEKNYPSEVVAEAEKIAAKMPEEEKEELVYNIIVSTQGFINGSIDGSKPDYKDQFLKLIATYANIDKIKLREHFSSFLKGVIPVAEEAGVRMCVHPDDPSFPLLGLPRIVSNEDDLKWVCDQVDSPSNGITFCTGSLSTNLNNDLASIAKNLGPKIHFAHLRNNQVYENKCFYESGHLDGTLDMFPIVRNLLIEQKRRAAEGRKDLRMPFRPDHGMKMLDDFGKETNPGYPLIGRMRGLAEINGLMTGIERSLEL
jgi:mannonate dehydratase